MAMLNFVSCTKEEETKTAIANGIVSFKMNSSEIGLGIDILLDAEESPKLLLKSLYFYLS